ncbi:MAG: DUF177 domain-containing protein [Anaerolineae bacterium]
MHLLQSIMLTLNVSTLLKAPLGKSLTLDIDTGPKVLDELEVDYLRGSVQVLRVEKGLFVEGTVESQLRLECVRCLEPFAFPVTLELAELFRMPGAETTPDTVYALSEDGEIDLAPLVREHAWLAIPMKHLCDPECKGLCFHCGVNLNTESCQCEDIHVDPRLAPLKELL